MHFPASAGRSRAVCIAPLALFFFAACSSLADAFAFSFTEQSPYNYFRHRKQTMQHHLQEIANNFHQHTVRPSSTVVDRITERFFPQWVDHFSAKSGTFNQRFWSNDAFVIDWKTAPVFLLLRGESPTSDWDVANGMFFYELAQQQHSLLLSLEHRFYGKSQTTGDWTTDSLCLLNSKQALADAATFVAYINAQYNLTSANPWVVFGGSYSGALAAWFRIQYPQLVIAAVASSAIVHPMFNLHAFPDMASAALSDPNIGGSLQCAASTRAAFSVFDKMLSTADGRLQVSALFSTCENITSDMDAALFAAVLNYVFQDAVQYDSSPYSTTTVSSLCAIMTNSSHSSPMGGLLEIRQAHLRAAGNDCADGTYSSYVDWMMNTTADDKSNARQWVYQMCTEFGLWQACEAPGCILSRLADLPSKWIDCVEVFGLPADPNFYEQKVQENILTYGGSEPVGSNIVYVNGDTDPWMSLSVLQDRPVNQTAILIRGGTHCDDMSSSSATDTPSLIAAHKQIKSLVSAFISDYRRGRS